MRTRLFVLLTCFAVTACAAAEPVPPVAETPAEPSAPAAESKPAPVFDPPPFAADFAQAMEWLHVEHYAKAWPLLRPLAEAGHTRAQYYLGLSYARYAHTQRSDLKSCEGRDKSECLAAGIFWLRKSAAQGFAPAQFWLGYHLALIWSWPGKSHREDIAEAAFWLRQAARQRFAPAMNRLAEEALLTRFRYVDRIEARMWAYLYDRHKIAPKNYFQGFDDPMKFTAPHVTPEQDVEARRRAEEFKFDPFD